MTALDRTSRESARAHPLDSVVWSSLTGPHAPFAERTDGALRYPSEISPFATLVPALDGPSEGWADLAALAGRGTAITLTGPAHTIDGMPADWELALRMPGVQMIGTPSLDCGPDPEAVLLGAEDVPEMLDLVRRTEPGPFLSRTHELGRYLGIRHGGALVAMAGERMHPPGWIEVSAVCTDPAFRGRGLARRLIQAVAHGIREAGEMPFLHAAAGNTAAIGLYESLGFAVRWSPEFFFLRTPE